MILLLRSRFNIVSFTYVTCTFTSFDMADKHIWPENQTTLSLSVSCGHNLHVISLFQHFILYSFELVWMFLCLHTSQSKRHFVSVLFIFGHFTVMVVHVLEKTIVQQLMKFSWRLCLIFSSL